MGLNAQYTVTTPAFRLLATPTTGFALPASDPSATGDRPPAVLLQAEVEDIRFTIDGSAPTSSVGMLLPAGGEPFFYAGPLIDMRFIQAASGAILNVTYVGLSDAQGPAGTPGAAGPQGPAGPTGPAYLDVTDGVHTVPTAVTMTLTGMVVTDLGGGNAGVANVVPAGGLGGQVLTKIDSSDYNLDWETPLGGQPPFTVAQQAPIIYDQSGHTLIGLNSNTYSSPFLQGLHNENGPADILTFTNNEGWLALNGTNTPDSISNTQLTYENQPFASNVIVNITLNDGEAAGMFEVVGVPRYGQRMLFYSGTYAMDGSTDFSGSTWWLVEGDYGGSVYYIQGDGNGRKSVGGAIMTTSDGTQYSAQIIHNLSLGHLAFFGDLPDRNASPGWWGGDVFPGIDPGNRPTRIDFNMFVPVQVD